MADPLVLVSNICDGYPSCGIPIREINITGLNSCLMSTYDSCFDGYPSFNKETKSLSSIPKSCISIYNDILESYPSFGVQVDNVLTDIPKAMMTCIEKYKTGYPSYRKSDIMFGTFADTSKLQEVIIPKSVKFIADYAFYNSSIKTVTISKDCIYGEHSFPEECKIKFYN